METKHIRVSLKAREYLMINKAKTMQTPAEKIDELLFGVADEQPQLVTEERDSISDKPQG